MGLVRRIDIRPSRVRPKQKPCMHSRAVGLHTRLQCPICPNSKGVKLFLLGGLLEYDYLFRLMALYSAIFTTSHIEGRRRQYHFLFSLCSVRFIWCYLCPRYWIIIQVSNHSNNRRANHLCNTTS
jgi:hypothetical protein